jgi:hypothetical protein
LDAAFRSEPLVRSAHPTRNDGARCAPCGTQEQADMVTERRVRVKGMVASGAFA